MVVGKDILKFSIGLIVASFCIQLTLTKSGTFSQAFQILSNKLDSPGIFRPLLPNFIGLKLKSTTSTSPSTPTSTTTRATTRNTTTTSSAPAATPSTTTSFLSTVATLPPSSSSSTSSPITTKLVPLFSYATTETDSINVDSSSKEHSSGEYEDDPQESSLEGDNISSEELQLLDPASASVIKKGMDVGLIQTTNRPSTLKKITLRPVKKPREKKASASSDDSDIIVDDNAKEASDVYQGNADYGLKDDTSIDTPSKDSGRAVKSNARAPNFPTGRKVNTDTTNSQSARIKQKQPYRMGKWKPLIDVNSPLGIYHPVQLLYDSMYEQLKKERQLLEHNLWMEKIKARRETVLGRQINPQ